MESLKPIIWIFFDCVFKILMYILVRAEETNNQSMKAKADCHFELEGVVIPSAKNMLTHCSLAEKCK